MELLESALSNTLAFVFVLGVMVLIHELGHFWAARYFDVRVESFSFGFGPRLFGFRRGDTDYKVCALPLGGYVKMAGENVGEPTGDPREFLSKPRWQRLIIAFMGPLFNGILAVALLTGFYLFHYERPVLSEPPVVAAVVEDSPAAKAGVRAGDVIRSIEGEPTPDWSAVTLSEVLAVNKTVSVQVLRDGSTVDLEIPVEARERVFARFHRELGSGHDGSGLGLSIVRRLVEVLGARIELDDSPGLGGLRVQVWLPRAEPDHGDEASSTVPPSRPVINS